MAEFMSGSVACLDPNIFEDKILLTFTAFKFTKSPYSLHVCSNKTIW